MSFFNPWLWFGLSALAAPVWLHLQRRTEKTARIFPGLKFLEESPVARRAPLSLRDLLLFLLRAGAIALLTAGLAWPYWSRAGAGVVTISRVYIIDNTLSAQADGGFERDREAVGREIGRLPETSQAAVVELTGQARTIVNFGDSREDAQGKVKALKGSAERGPYLAAFRQAQTLLDRAIGQRREIVFYSDQQTNQWEENTNTLGFLREVEVKMGRSADRANRDNAAISTPNVQRIFLGDRAQLKCQGQLQRSGRPGKGAIVIEVNGKEIFRRALNFDEAPEIQPVGALWEGHPTEWIEGRMWLEHGGDALVADDAAWFAAPPVVEGKVAVLARSPFVLAALSPAVVRGHWRMEKIDPAHLEKLNSEAGAADVLILEASYLQSEAVRAAVEGYLGAGRGVFILVDRVTPIVSEALRNYGFEANESPVPQSPERLGKFLVTHRVLAPFASPDFGNLFGVEVGTHRQLQVARGTPLLFSNSGEVVLADGVQGAGRIMVSAFSFVREETSWVVDPSFVPFLDLALQHLRQDSAKVAFLEPGEILRVGLAKGETAQKLVLRKKGQVLGEVEVGADQVGQIRLPQEPGLYQVTFDGNPEIKRMVAVNVRAEESQLTYQTGPPPVLSSWMISPELTKESDPKSARRMEAVADRGQRLWWWLALAGLGLLTFESLVLSRIRRIGAQL